MTLATPAPTQVAHPWPTAIRTTVQTIVGVILALVSIIAAAEVFAPQFLAAVRDVLPPEWLPYAVGAVAFIGALAGAVARVMAIPGVNEWLTALSLGAAGKHAA